MKRRYNLLIWDRVVNVDDLDLLEKDELINLVLHLNMRLRDVMNETDWLKKEDIRLGNIYIDKRS